VIPVDYFCFPISQQLYTFSGRKTYGLIEKFVSKNSPEIILPRATISLLERQQGLIFTIHATEVPAGHPNDFRTKTAFFKIVFVTSMGWNLPSRTMSFNLLIAKIYRHKGVGQWAQSKCEAMISESLIKSKLSCCDLLANIPSGDLASNNFYRQQGYKCKKILRAKCDVMETLIFTKKLDAQVTF
jgi:hypothetical protein